MKRKEDRRKKKRASHSRSKRLSISDRKVSWTRSASLYASIHVTRVCVCRS